MAQRGVQLEQERSCCSICQHLPKDPVTTGCGHSYCKSCINTHWDKEEERGSYSCPQCRQTFTPRPVLEKSTMADDLAEKLKKTGLHDAPERTEKQRDLGLPQPKQKPRAVFLKYSQQITLDPNTAHRHMLLSEGNRKVTFMKEEQTHDDHPDRFTGWCYVLSNKPLNQPCYWEVEVKGINTVGVAVSDKKIGKERKLKTNKFGYHDKSWMLRCHGISHDFVAEKKNNSLPGRLSYKVGVYYREGVLYFLRVVSDTVTLLKRVETKSTQPLYAGLSVYSYGSTAEFCKLK